ncbi:hypothetical protein OPS25_07900 [Alteromonas ponticola]|uniref:Uncharacterized protein n=1 Tax=Alteromonas aquimaris TaxID=2998417 RepID=A0ABT3P6L8_9ALTE|nr:hypothetical protein [Alteromonas aquimaris]MCW8108414.1 hypothetical protein [Alteromonas aquimaris]
MSAKISEQHAKTLIAVMEQTSNWKLHPEKKPAFSSSRDALDYVETHNEPLCIEIPVVGKDKQLSVKVTSSGEDMVFTHISFEEPVETRVHNSHFKLISSSVADMLNAKLPEGEKVASF